MPSDVLDPAVTQARLHGQALDNTCGHPLDMQGINELAALKELIVLADMADSAGSNRKAMTAIGSDTLAGQL